VSIDFTLPADLEAHDPPEARGIPRDGVRMLSAGARRAGSAITGSATCPPYWFPAT
jgi:hypothetical protein